ncbi:DUF1684 domain-containing protein [Lentiprolixibacter aurantiacus]|uniref:DUF1684 domain-containing protein n=1 Tax=Lentiprolixibacter aurantiacus TaxID=2993939 RepID=A0AAE3MPC8_9FLAO|nr:DUF1684 domain-containing protein [Lentiprolixibacter aurantiacus]MCX2720532.1 DUF1684 domain-containing protein [Lentiprolixibacter aurantiacus]
MQRFFVSVLIVFIVVMASCRDAKRYHDTVEDKRQLTSEALKDIDEFQKKLNADFRNPEVSPLPDRYRKDFMGLEFFEPDTNFRVWARLEYTPEAIPFLMPTNTDRESEEQVFAIAHFTLEGRPFSLEIYQTLELLDDPGFEDYLFLPFLDATNGEETYSGGRYIDLRIPEGDSLLIDFNKAYNPYCVYNKSYSCPLVPRANTLDIPVRAGVKDFKMGK